MPRFQVAHINEQGIDLIITEVDPSFGYKPQTEQQEIMAELQVRASGAGLRGTVVPVWSQGGRLAFLAPPQWHPFFRGFTASDFLANVNRELYW